MRTPLAILALTTLTALPAAAQTITEDLKLTASDAAGGDLFGHSVAISGSTAIVGAYRDEDSGPASGSAYIFDTMTGEQLFNLTPCPTDLNNSNTTDIVDLNVLLAFFGNSAGGDTNNDGTTDLADLNTLLAAFGTPCP